MSDMFDDSLKSLSALFDTAEADAMASEIMEQARLEFDLPQSATYRDIFAACLNRFSQSECLENTTPLLRKATDEEIKEIRTQALMAEANRARAKGLFH